MEQTGKSLVEQYVSTRQRERERGRQEEVREEGEKSKAVYLHYEKKSAPGLKDDGSDTLIIREF